MTDGREGEASGLAPARPTRTEQLVEVCVFLFLIVPSLTLSFLAYQQANLGFALLAIATILRDLALVCLVLFFLWRNGEPIQSLGWTLHDAGREALLGLGLFIPFFFSAAVLASVLQAAGLTGPATPVPSFLTPKGTTETILAVALVIVVAVAEETIFRGYLILRFQNITASPGTAVLLSAVIFSLGHGYEGSAGVVTVGAIGVVFALIYLWRKSLIAPVVMHFLQDFIGVVVVSLLRLR